MYFTHLCCGDPILVLAQTQIEERIINKVTFFFLSVAGLSYEMPPTWFLLVELVHLFSPYYTNDKNNEPTVLIDMEKRKSCWFAIIMHRRRVLSDFCSWQFQFNFSFVHVDRLSSRPWISFQVFLHIDPTGSIMFQNVSKLFSISQKQEFK